MMSHTCVVSVCHNSRGGDSLWKQVLRPVSSSSSFATMDGSRKWIELSSLRRWLDWLAFIVMVSWPISSFMRPRAFWMAGKSMNEYDAC